jgi:hypothetical protein
VVQEDLVGALRSSLEEERSVRDELGEQLQTTQSELQRREETLAERERRMAALNADLEKKASNTPAANVADSQATVAQLTAHADRRRGRDQTRAGRTARQGTRRETAAPTVSAAGISSEQKDPTQQQIQTLNTQVQVANTERVMLLRVDTLRTQVTPSATRRSS